MQVGASPYQPQPINYASYLSSPNYAGDPGTYSPGATSQQGFYASIYMTMMQTSVQLQAGFSQFMGQANSYQGFLPQPSQGYGTPAPSYNTGSSYGGGGGGGYATPQTYSAPTSYATPAPYVAPKPAPAPAPAPAPPAKKGGYA